MFRWPLEIVCWLYKFIRVSLALFYYFLIAFIHFHMFITCLFINFVIWYFLLITFKVSCNLPSFPLSPGLEKQWITAVLAGRRRLFSVHSSAGSSAVRCRKNISPACCAQGVSATSGRCNYPGGRNIFWRRQRVQEKTENCEGSSGAPAGKHRAAASGWPKIWCWS